MRLVSKSILKKGEKMSIKRKAPGDRREEIILTFIGIARIKGYQTVTREQVAASMGVSPALVTRYFNESMSELRETVMKECVERRVLRIIAQGLSVNDPTACEAPHEIKTKAANLLLI